MVAVKNQWDMDVYRCNDNDSLTIDVLRTKDAVFEKSVQQTVQFALSSRMLVLLLTDRRKKGVTKIYIKIIEIAESGPMPQLDWIENKATRPGHAQILKYV